MNFVTKLTTLAVIATIGQTYALVTSKQPPKNMYDNVVMEGKISSKSDMLMGQRGDIADLSPIVIDPNVYASMPAHAKKRLSHFAMLVRKLISQHSKAQPVVKDKVNAIGSDQASRSPKLLGSDKGSLPPKRLIGGSPKVWSPTTKTATKDMSVLTTNQAQVPAAKTITPASPLLGIAQNKTTIMAPMPTPQAIPGLSEISKIPVANF